MTQREVTDAENVRWTCMQAFAALGESAAAEAAEKLGASNGKVPVVCTPSGGAQSVRLELPENWAEACSEEDLLRALKSAQS